MRWLLLAFLVLPGMAFGAVSNQAVTSRDTVSLISAANAAAGGNIKLALHFQLRPGWHIYWVNPGDAGLAPQITLDPPARASAFDYPPPQLLAQNGVAAFVLSGDVLLPFTASGAGDAVSATARWLVCSDICVPEHAHFVLPLTGGASPETASFGPSSIAASPFAVALTRNGILMVAGLTPQRVAAAHFFPLTPGQIDNDAAQGLAFSGAGMSLHLPLAGGFDLSKPLAGVLELTDRGGGMQALAVTAAPATGTTTPLLAWLALAFLGGLILNLMPCVFPVLAMKALGLARLGGGARGPIRREALAYTAGVLTAMLLLACLLLLLRGFGAAIGWGFQLQSPIFVALMALLILAIALNLAGAFTINFTTRLAAPGSFLTGLLAVAVATPCTAPFMGGAIAAALVAPLPAALGIFLCLGLGLAAPFLLLALVPATARLLPRPGAWMVTLQRALSLPMFATFLWLGWVFLTQVAAAPLPGIPGAEPYSASRLATLRAGGQKVFVDMTASWCITCLVNERAVLEQPDVQKQFAASNTKILVGDWTSRSPEITAYLQTNHRDGVPLYAFYPAHAAPIILPQILTPGIVEAAMK